MNNIPYQQEFCPPLPNVYGAKDYREFRANLVKMNEVLISSGFEHSLINDTLAQEEKNRVDKKPLSAQQQAKRYEYLKTALRCNIARHLMGESYRRFSIHLSDSQLLQWFVGIHDLGTRRSISKSSLKRYEEAFDHSDLGDKIRSWLSSLSEEKVAQESGLPQAIDYTVVWLDSTCIEADIHFPVDWLLLRDAARSLLSAIITIRAQGLKHRIISPSELLKMMNQFCIKMTHTRRKKQGKKQRKAILRAMKKLIHRIKKHGERYRALLTEHWEKTDWTEKQMQQVIQRLDNILDQLPSAVKQAHDRIIGERKIAPSEKKLSFYDHDAHVIVRGKAGHEVEFGQSLLLAEQKDGLIIDWELTGSASPSDTQRLLPAINRMKASYGSIDQVCTDRGFNSAANDQYLEENNIGNATCPKSPQQLQEKLKNPIFVALQTRRSQTEARLGIFKHAFLGKPLRSRVTSNKRQAIVWCVLTHNLWVLARMALADEQRSLAEKPLKKAA